MVQANRQNFHELRKTIVLLVFLGSDKLEDFDRIKSRIEKYKKELVSCTSAGDLIEVEKNPKINKEAVGPERSRRVKINKEEITLGLKL